MTPPPLRRRRAKAKAQPVRAWALLDWDEQIIDGVGFYGALAIYPSEDAAAEAAQNDDAIQEIQITTAPKRGRKKGKR